MGQSTLVSAIPTLKTTAAIGHARTRWNSVEYDPRPGEDGARRNIAYALIALLSIIVFAVLLLLACSVVQVGDLKEFSFLLGPVITLVSAATGFYYGTKST